MSSDYIAPNFLTQQFGPALPALKVQRLSLLQTTMSGQQKTALSGGPLSLTYLIFFRMNAGTIRFNNPYMSFPNAYLDLESCSGYLPEDKLFGYSPF